MGVNTIANFSEVALLVVEKSCTNRNITKSLFNKELFSVGNFATTVKKSKWAIRKSDLILYILYYYILIGSGNFINWSKTSKVKTGSGSSIRKIFNNEVTVCGFEHVLKSTSPPKYKIF